MTHHTTPERRAKLRADRAAPAPQAWNDIPPMQDESFRRARSTTPCTGCTPATTLHRVHLPVCNANQCKQGHQPCPTPQACQLPDCTDCTDEAPATGMEMTGFVLAVLALVVAIGSALFSCASA